MNVNKSEVKMAVAQDIGRQFEAREDGLKSEVHRLEGAAGALKQGAEKLDGIKDFYRKEAEEERFEEVNLEIVMRVIDRCRGVLINLSDTATAQKLVKVGEAQEAKRALDTIEKVYQDERARLSAVLAAIEGGELTQSEAAEGRPQNDAAADLAARRAAARAEKASKVDSDVSEAPGAVSVDSAGAPDEEAKIRDFNVRAGKLAGLSEESANEVAEQVVEKVRKTRKRKGV